MSPLAATYAGTAARGWGQFMPIKSATYWMANVQTEFGASVPDYWSHVISGPGGNIYALSRYGHLLKFDTDGRLLWQKYFSSMSSARIVLLDGYLYIGGGLSQNVIKLSTDGVTQWARSMGSGYFGGVNVNSSGMVYRNSGALLYSIYPSGSLYFTRLIGGSNTFSSGYQLRVSDLNSSVYLIGLTASDTVGLIVKLSQSGSLVWSYRINGATGIGGFEVNKTTGAIYITANRTVSGVQKATFIRLQDNGGTASIAWQREWATPATSYIDTTSNPVMQTINIDSSDRVYFGIHNPNSPYQDTFLRFNSSNVLQRVYEMTNLVGTIPQRVSLAPYSTDPTFLLSVGGRTIGKHAASDLFTTGLPTTFAGHDVSAAYIAADEATQLVSGTHSLTSVSTTVFSTSLPFNSATDNGTTTAWDYNFRALG